MKKFLITWLVCALIVVSAVIVFGLNTRSSGPITADVAVTTKAGYITGLSMFAPADSGCTVIAYDDKSAATSGNQIFETNISGVESAIYGIRFKHMVFPNPLHFNSGLYLDVSSGMTAYVEYANE